MKNFKEETLKAIQESGHTESDVMFIGSSDGKYRISIDNFKELSDFSYDSGFGGAEIARDLIIYFKDKSYITRGEYDGSEWWEYNSPKDFSEADESKPLKFVSNTQVEDSWAASVEELNTPKD